MPDWWSKLIDVVKHLELKKVVATLALSYWISLFYTPTWANQIDKSYLLYFKVIGTLSTTYLLVLLFIWLWKHLSFLSNLQLAKKYLQTLSEREKAILRIYIQDGNKTASFATSDGDIQALSNHMILYRGSNISHGGDDWDFNINSWAWKYLTKNPQLLESDKEKKVSAYDHKAYDPFFK